jgi:ABC-type glutathione transport system ATPase component
MEQVKQACEKANIWDVIMDPQKFPNGLETQMSVVQNVSGGEKQRICIARAILADPPILLLDEATSALDELSQAHVQEALNKLMTGRTTMVVAHRLSTIKDSDKIIGMDKGRVVDDGTHEELLKKPNGVWAGLWNLWQKKGEGNAEADHGSSEPPPTEIESKPIVALSTLESNAYTASGQCDVLRQAIATLVNTSERQLREEGAQRVLSLVDELEEQVCETKHTAGAETESNADSNAGGDNHPSGWTRLRNLHRAAKAFRGTRKLNGGTSALSNQKSQSTEDEIPIARTHSGASVVRSITLERRASSASNHSVHRILSNKS